jgi:hypothetical protein
VALVDSEKIGEECRRKPSLGEYKIYFENNYDSCQREGYQYDPM